jgi:hypothetical protein
MSHNKRSNTIVDGSYSSTVALAAQPCNLDAVGLTLLVCLAAVEAFWNMISCQAPYKRSNNPTECYDKPSVPLVDEAALLLGMVHSSAVH